MIGFDPLSVLGKDYKIGSVCFSTYQILPSIIEEVKADMLVRSQNNVYEWIDMFTCGLMFQPSLAILFKPFGFLALK
jgi:hypothetical protein